MTNRLLKSLYERDYILWLDRTVEALKNRELEAIDWQNLIEEVESLGRSQKHELRSRLITLFEHALKIKYVNSPCDFRGWAVTITRTQIDIADLLQDSPSLYNYFIAILSSSYASVLKIVQTEYGDFFPLAYPFPQDPDRLLNNIFWE